PEIDAARRRERGETRLRVVDRDRPGEGRRRERFAREAPDVHGARGAERRDASPREPRRAAAVGTRELELLAAVEVAHDDDAVARVASQESRRRDLDGAGVARRDAQESEFARRVSPETRRSVEAPRQRRAAVGGERGPEDGAVVAAERREFAALQGPEPR